MNTELATRSAEMAISNLENKISEVERKLQIVQAEKMSKLEDSLYSPRLYEHYRKIADMLAQTNMVPSAYKGKPGDVFVAMAMGYQLGLPVEQSLQDIAIIRNRPCLWGDGLLAVAMGHADFESIKETPMLDGDGNTVGYQCTVTRKGHEPHTKTFTLNEARQAGLISDGKGYGSESCNTPWKTYPTRMLQMRARSLALRDKFADALRGIRIAEVEQEDHEVIEGNVNKLVSKGITQTDKLKQLLGIGGNINDPKPTDKRNTGNGNEGSKSSQNGADRNVSDVGNNNDTYHNINNIPVLTGEENGLSGQKSPTNNDPQDNRHGRDGGNERKLSRVSSEQLDSINALLIAKKINSDRLNKALSYYKVNAIEEFSPLQANKFLSQLERINV